MPQPTNATDDQRLHLAGAALLFGMAVLLAGLAYVQVVTALEHEAEQKNQSRRTVRLPAVRGAILDAQGRPLAHDRPSYVIHAYLSELRHHFRKAWREAPHDTRTEAGVRHRVISDFIAQLQLDQPFILTEAQLQKHFIEQLALPIPVMRDLSQTNVAWFMENAWRVPGMDVEAQPHRHYPSKSVAHLVGRLRRPQSIPDEERPYNYRLPDFTGAMGLERTFNETLRGSAGTKSLLVNNLGYRQREKIVVAPTPGNNVVLTLDLEIQEAAYKAIKETGRKGAAAVVMNVQTGDIIALASLPVFDPNVFIPGIHSDLWNEYREARPSPLLFRATQERYPPGSIFKIISGLSALESGSNPTNFVYNPGYAKVGRRRIDDTAPPGHYDFREAFKHSSNTYFREELPDNFSSGTFHGGYDTFFLNGLFRFSFGVFLRYRFRFRLDAGGFVFGGEDFCLVVFFVNRLIKHAAVLDIGAAFLNGFIPFYLVFHSATGTEALIFFFCDQIVCYSFVKYLSVKLLIKLSVDRAAHFATVPMPAVNTPLTSHPN
ncbi:penicillin-binding transpeptidase domain-containing protein [Verrucomicrobia bacterium]|nr:penicillin-binding transpeptidase domain-containing protein [Verrucomicrobiota bacterium]